MSPPRRWLAIRLTPRDSRYRFPIDLRCHIFIRAARRAIFASQQARDIYFLAEDKYGAAGASCRWVGSGRSNVLRVSHNIPAKNYWLSRLEF